MAADSKPAHLISRRHALSLFGASALGPTGESKSADAPAPSIAPVPPQVRLCLGITGHREDNPAYVANCGAIESVLDRLMDLICAAQGDERPWIEGGAIAVPQMHTLLADGADQLGARHALARAWELVAPLPFSLALNVAINAHPQTADDARVLLAVPRHGTAAVNDRQVKDRADAILRLAQSSRCFELADRDASLTQMFLARFQHPDDVRTATTFAAECSLRVALAGRVMVEQSDLLIAIWDGVTRALIGGTGHTIQVALEAGTPVLWIDANHPGNWRILSGPEALVGRLPAAVANGSREEQLLEIVHRALRPAPPQALGRRHRHVFDDGPELLTQERLQRHSSRRWQLYRRIESLFGADTTRDRFQSLRQAYERPEEIASGSAAHLLTHARALPGQHPDYVDRMETRILRRFAWADGVSAQLSDTYRGGMTANFVLAPLAIVGGIAYLPFGNSDLKWLFALFELALLTGVLAITLTGQKRRWHTRWFETRRLAEYFRHSPILLLLGVARPPGRWPLGTDTSWPEWYARHALREVGLPQLAVTQSYLRSAVRDVLQEHVVRQRDYHVAKARRLAAVHHNLDKVSEILFLIAVFSVALYLALRGAGALHLLPDTAAHSLSNLFTFLGVLLPTFGGAIAGIRYFGDFERFAAISRVTSEKLHGINARIELLLAAPEGALDYSQAADLAHATDDVVVAEIESWQAVFGGKHVTVPV